MTALSIVRKYFPNVTKVLDAKEKITVEVTAKDNKAAAVRNHKACAMAVACKKKMKADGVIVSIATAYVIFGDTAYRYQVPEHVQREIVSFDRDAGFAIGEYTLNPPSEKLGAIPGGGTHGKDRNNPATKIVHKQHTEGIRTVLGSGLS